MAIKMRVRKQKDKCCNACGCKPDEALDLFDVMIGDTLITICDDCMETLMVKSLNAKCYTNGRLKQAKDIRISNRRQAKKRAEGKWA